MPQRVVRMARVRGEGEGGEYKIKKSLGGRGSGEIIHTILHGQRESCWKKIIARKLLPPLALIDISTLFTSFLCTVTL